MKKQNQHALFSFIPFSDVETVASCCILERFNLFSAEIVLLHHLGGVGGGVWEVTVVAALQN